MAVGKPDEIVSDALVHRVGGGSIANLRLSALDAEESPPGISVLLGGSPQAAAQQMRNAFPRSKKWVAASKTVGTTTAGAIRRAGFDVLPDSTNRFPNHARLVHPDGLAGFDDAHLTSVAPAFDDTSEC